jgi:small subunit ribosomal protein S20
MANTKSAEKRARQTKTRTLRNKILKTRVKNARKDALAAIASGDANLISAKMAQFASTADKAAKSGVIHKNTASRLKGRVALASNKAAAVAAAPVVEKPKAKAKAASKPKAKAKK